jgi:transposase-like protein
LVFKENKNIIFWAFVDRETYLNYLMAFSKLNAAGYIIKSVTSDKHGSIVGAVKTAFPDIPHQYCLVHIQRRCETLLTQKPETQAGKDLLELVRFINKIKTLNDKQIFLNWLVRYEKRYQLTLKQRTYDNKSWWYTHKNLRLAFNTLKSSQNNMFFYLENNNIPKDTNGLEAEFTHLKTKLNMHRGLSKSRKENYVFWYWFLKSIYLNQH